MEKDERRKVPLKPGHSLMDWLNLCRNNKNLSGRTTQGTGVTKAELRQHKTVETGVVRKKRRKRFSIDRQQAFGLHSKGMFSTLRPTWNFILEVWMS
jgi:hypothetical protein